ncbi:hypothetical protein A3C98_02660 [Candidatus Roizmanbacteria bacterium RIFCSPHIGHO2_02_FULL_37_15]|uniref:Glycosyl transferase family 1 domain-containing protein n=1 Tax=Candidatus Roizmanbacteria bacterium RIFCSPLOWO2_01_FULL_37_16 TaxID=1802058 RepID=A0A1F7ILW5_9BACT|nr:MAG: hypothetical protein A3C98_02660 [Candidatus Roizmanbacteria bacterium RIFCSPHIGHO2_02_FULL_37_15]OGK31852.1 MAG: hypothetical protein A3F57_01875 [Candidatus Roizmanbacteria bacterium RIFCSPHIGHO2_12_FULL_36_11]OGK44343.1 MAG: hypothetical protein A3B40_01825 [Candidatus Roizmanbacteria bacterium RIFCSPLOWO2_01_FULL_37_16]OGK57076.1 MAG: hypothetical protein A3I50_01685 [Candidatus Roizmanbacteria bacterium RIFCSPLOWO2_02_FULL_37_9]
MKIGVNARVLQNVKTGIPYFVKQLYSELVKIDKENQYIFFQPKKNSLLHSFLFDNFSINWKIEKSRVDIFHGPANLLPIFKRSGIKYIVTVHDLSFLIYPSYQSAIFNLYYKYFVGRSLKNADIVVADSNNTKKDIINYYHIPADKIKVIYLGVSGIFFKTEIKNRLIKDKYFLTLTTHPQRKNTLAILEAVKINNKLLNYKLVIAGLIEEGKKDLLKERIHNLKLTNNIILWGYAKQKDLINLYQHAEFFIYPSFYEGFGLPVLEAMASKCPVITSDNSSLVEITRDKTWLVNPRSPTEISVKMLNLLNLSASKRIELINKNYIFSKKFTWRNTARQYLKNF